jgi:hypothetical protein
VIHDDNARDVGKLLRASLPGYLAMIMISSLVIAAANLWPGLTPHQRGLTILYGLIPSSVVFVIYLVAVGMRWRRGR